MENTQILLQLHRGKSTKLHECGNCVYRCLDTCDIFGPLDTTNTKYQRLPLCMEAEENLKHIQRETWDDAVSAAQSKADTGFLSDLYEQNPYDDDPYRLENLEEVQR